MRATIMHGAGDVRVESVPDAVLADPTGEDEQLLASLLTLSDVMGTGHHAAVHAHVAPGKIAAVARIDAHVVESDDGKAFAKVGCRDGDSLRAGTMGCAHVVLGGRARRDG